MSKMILSLDLASKQSGWSVIEDDKVLGYGIIQPRPLSLKADERLPIIEKELEAVLAVWPKIKLAVIENPAGGQEDSDRGPDKNWLTLFTLAEVHGVARNILQKHKIPYEIVSPSTWQAVLGIHKRDRYSRKEGAKKYVEKKYGLVNKEQDIYDAICLYDCYVEQNREEVSAF